jgi:Protein of unknown function (DUF3179)
MRPGSILSRAALGLLPALLIDMTSAMADSASWRQGWSRTEFSRHSVAYDEILSGGLPKDGIPAIDNPSFMPVSEVRGLAPHAPVISVAVDSEAKAYPLRIMIWHEIVNDTVGGVPIAVTWCPLCNSAVVFDRRAGGRTLSFGTTGNLRNSDLVMYDRETESWWQQFGGECIVGALLGAELKLVPMRVESFDRFASRFPHGRVLLAPAGSQRAYGQNPYGGYDSAAAPFLYRGKYAGPVAPLARVVAVGDEAWTLDLVKQRRRIEAGHLVLTWEPGQASPLDTADIDAGQDIGNVVVQRRRAEGLEDSVYDVSFAFAFHAFHPNAPIHAE